jgi:hypothetical protein
LTKAFRKIDDARGSVIQFPTFDDSSVKKTMNAEKEHKQGRWQKHLVLDSAFVASLRDNRSRSGVQPSETRGSKADTKRKRAFVALHHFHPVLLMNKDVLPVKSNGQLGTLKDKVLVSVVRNSAVGDRQLTQTASLWCQTSRLLLHRRTFVMPRGIPSF